MDFGGEGVNKHFLVSTNLAALHKNSISLLESLADSKELLLKSCLCT